MHGQQNIKVRDTVV